MPILPWLSRVGDPGDSAEIAVESCFSPFKAPSPLPSVEKALNIDVNLTLSGRKEKKSKREYEEVRGMSRQLQKNEEICTCQECALQTLWMV